MKKIMFLLVVIVTVFISSNFTPVKADIGPKPAVEVTIIGVDENYSFDLLVYSSSELTNINTEPWSYYQDEYPEALIGFQDDEGYISYALYSTPAVIRFSETTSEGNIYLMNYHSPSKFKIVLVGR